MNNSTEELEPMTLLNLGVHAFFLAAICADKTNPKRDLASKELEIISPIINRKAEEHLAKGKTSIFE